jgi:hypothetical protein
MLTSSPRAGFPQDLQEIPPERRISQCFTWNFVNAGAILLIFAAYVLLKDARSEVDWTMGWPALAGGSVLLAYDRLRRRQRRTLVVSGLQVVVYRGAHFEGTGNIDEFVFQGPQFSLRQLLTNHFAMQLAATFVVLGLVAVLAAFEFGSIALFGHSILGDAYSDRDRLFASLACIPSLGYIVNLVLAAYFRVEVAYRLAAASDGFELLIGRSAARPFRPVTGGAENPRDLARL